MDESKKKKVKTLVKAKKTDKEPAKKERKETWLTRFTGIQQKEFGFSVYEKTVYACTNGMEEAQIKSILGGMLELAPRDGFEGMLISQMIAVYHHAMECFMLVNSDSNRKSMELYSGLQNQGVKLMRTYLAQMEALKKYRTGGQQKMIVEHVHVNEGGQAVIGNVSKGGGDDKKK